MNTLNDLITRIDKITEVFNNAFSSYSPGQLNLKPDQKTWSIAQIIDHIIITNESYFPVIDTIRKGEYKTPFLARITPLVNLLGKLILNGVEPDRKRKIKTFPVWEPSVSDLPDGQIKRFLNHQENLKTLISDSVDLIRNEMVISSPANKNIVYKLETAFEIIVTHEMRHCNQALEVKALLEKLPLNSNE